MLYPQTESNEKLKPATSIDPNTVNHKNVEIYLNKQENNAG